jgi:hypothetical protein
MHEILLNDGAAFSLSFLAFSACVTIFWMATF